LGFEDCVYLGNLDAERDWGHARDYIEGMWLILQQEKPDDYVLATGTSHSVRSFVEFAFKEVGKSVVWEGTGINEVGRDKDTGKALVRIDARYFRPTELYKLCGDSSKARSRLNWKPRRSFEDMVREMVRSDIDIRTKEGR
ncbi:MAG: GDP-mannose 4,6-dehydratase, partial [Rhodospirillales bacterium]|nr:GDP-mannose 4,6-dehydratase [Rhodospirillales bacterium]